MEELVTRFHATHVKNLRGILPRGLLCSKARGTDKVVWVCNGDNVGWALAHCAKRHAWKADDMIVLELTLDAFSLRDSGRAGLFRYILDVQPADITGMCHISAGVTLKRSLGIFC